MIKNVKWFFVVLVFSSLISLSFSKESVPTEKLTSGDKLPELRLCEDMQSLNMHAPSNGFLLLSFWASYDAASRENNAALSHLAGGDARVKMVSVSFDRYASVFESVVKQDGLDADACFLETRGTDSELFDQFDLKSGFTNFLIDSNGMIVAKNITPAELVSFLNE